MKRGPSRRSAVPNADARARSRPGAARKGERRIARVLVLADAAKGAVGALVRELEPWFEERAGTIVVERDLREFVKRRAGRQKDGARPDLVVVLGGDGAILAAVRAFADDPVPTIGIHFGRVGFLASVEATRWEESLALVLEGRAVVEPRMRLVAEFASEGRTTRAVALNDAVITRGAFQGMLTTALRDGVDWVTNYRSDGLIVSTPSGSTAYSMAAGGPILAPSMNAFVVTPVSPQALSHRPLVIDGDHELVLSLTHASGITTLVVDGQGFYPLRQGDTVRITRHPLPYPLLSLPGFDAYKRLRERLGWRGSVEPDVFPDA